MTKLALKVETTFKKIDIRRDKEYAKRCNLKVRVPEVKGHPETHVLGFHAIHDFRERMERLLPSSKVDCASFSSNPTWHVKLGYRRNADRPKEIASDAEVRDLLPTDSEICKAVRQAHKETTLRAKETEDQYTLLRHGTRLLEWLCGETQKQAKKNMRFEQRLAALSAEYMMEVATILPDELKEAVALATDEEGERFAPEAIELMKKHAEKYVKENTGSGLPRPFSRICNTNTIEWLQKLEVPDAK